MILSGLCDIYEVFGHGVNILQTVNMLPHDKFDKYKSLVIDQFCSMVESLNDQARCNSTCPKPKCQWPNLYRDLEEIEKSGTYRGVPMAQLRGEEINTRMGQKESFS